MWGWFYRYFISPFAVDKPKAVEQVKQKSMLITPEKFASLTSIVIDNFEGGYYHPSMLKNFKPSDQAKLKASGETMFGLDRKAGAQLAKYPEWKTFWQAVDLDKLANPGNWKYNSKGGTAAPKLKELASQIMYKWFSELAGKYLTENSIQAIANDDRLIIHFSYASWNGAGWFEKFAKALNKILEVTTDKESIFKQAIRARTESSSTVIKQQGANMISLFRKLHLIA